jgi:hypothetical protein
MRRTTSKATAIATILTLFLALAGSPALGQAELTQNKTVEFTGNKIIQTAYQSVEVQERGDESLYRQVVSVFYNEGTWGLLLETTSDSWVLLGEDTAYFLVDGERFERRLVSADREVQDGGSVYERKGVPLNEEIRTAIATAEEVRMKTGSYVFDISEAVDNEIQTIQAEL